jgi:hypothetical protein
MTAGASTEIRTEHLPITNLKCYRYVTLFGLLSFLLYPHHNLSLLALYPLLLPFIILLQLLFLLISF